jgi:predicted short-subunit dehydrogenase-like oxidoreductase (DUF2520 family)
MATIVKGANRFLLSAPDILAARKRKEKREAIAIVGPGRLGSTLSEKLAEGGYKIDEIIARKGSAAVKKLAKSLGAQVSDPAFARLDASVVWFCVPDSKIAEAATEFSNRDWRGKIALHSSGVLASDVLSALQKKGASAASVHPLMTFVRGSKPSLDRVPFAIEGDAAAVRAATRMVRVLGGKVFRIRKQDKVAYHTFATMICPLLVSLLTASDKVASLAGMSPRLARRRMMPILSQTLANYAKFGPAASFSGPIVRGDTETIAQHLAVLAKVPQAKRAYVGLALAALKYLPSENVQAMQKMLSREE